MYIRVHVVPGAKKERVVKASVSEFTMSVREPAERNLANRRVRELLALELGTDLGAVRIMSGHRSPTKMFSVDV